MRHIKPDAALLLLHLARNCDSNDTCRKAIAVCAFMQVEALARSVLRDPLHITVGERNTAQVSGILLRILSVF